MINTSRRNPDDRGIALALMMQELWHAEIERAVDRIKRDTCRTELDRWFRRMWYRALNRQRNSDNSELKDQMWRGSKSSRNK